MYDKSSLNNPITVIRLKSDNYNCYVSIDAYKAITLEMSTGDYGSHQSREIEVSCNKYQDILFSNKFGFIDLEITQYEEDSYWVIYDGKGDIYKENMYQDDERAKQEYRNEPEINPER